MTYKTCQNIFSEHRHVLLERYQEYVTNVVQQMEMSCMCDQKYGLYHDLNLLLYKPIIPHRFSTSRLSCGRSKVDKILYLVIGSHTS